MRKIIIDHHSDEEKEKLPYRSAKKKINNHEVWICHNLADFENQLSNINTDNEGIIFTILSHGYQTGITDGTAVNLILWEKLIELFENCRTKNKLYLNLTAICGSNKIKPYYQNSNKRIDQIWVTNNLTANIDRPIIAMQNENIQSIMNLFNPEIYEIYK